MPVLSWLFYANRNVNKRSVRLKKWMWYVAITIHKIVRIVARFHQWFWSINVTLHGLYRSHFTLQLDHTIPYINLYPEVTGPICQLPLPKLLYRLELFTLETCCGYGYDLARNSNSLLRIFVDRTKRTRHHRNCGALRKQHPYFQLNWFQRVRSSAKKENSCSGFPQNFRVYLH